MAKRSRSFVDDEERARLAVNSILPQDDDSDDYGSHKKQKFDSETKPESDEEPANQNLRCGLDIPTENQHRLVKEESDRENSSHYSKDESDIPKDDIIKTNQDFIEAKSDFRQYDKPKFYQDSEIETENLQKNVKEVASSEASTSNVDSPSGGTLCDVVAAHYNNVPESGLDERNRSRILHLRNFNNWIKSMLIDEFVTKVRESKPRGSSLKVLDIGCGKGGDLFKWRQGKITHLVCTDIAATSVDQCKERYTDQKLRAERERNFAPLFSAEFIVANCTKERLRERYSDVTMQLDLVSCQFAFHYCFESLPQAECMMRNAAECLRPGGYFFGTCPNANAIVSRARKAGGKKFGNDVYSVEFETPLDDEKPPPIFGAKYNFHMEGVVDCPEFLVHFPTFIRLAAKYGLDFVVCEPFQSFFDRMKEKGRGLLGKMQALETYPPFPDQTLAGPLHQYEHAEKNKNVGSHRLGTLSTAEWEAATLYLIFVFQKAASKS
ncbi:mRNA cap guanine-N7 methyltransferase [Frankliniella fusca]|uniref:mRNA cap guanine-N(7) methyltransferase n=1 Tax=Frankliniella fusca TaxID=407009 RepID=A0AAE1HND2_9NEOP|nr:mRNA cap guanine-N7 methyltransferase [Frankliniella fusca]